MTSIPKIRRLVEMMMFNPKKKSYVQVVKRNNGHNPYLFLNF